MTDLLAARSQMAMSLAFHIIFACIGMAMPLLMVLAERRWLKTRDPMFLELAKRWSKGTAVMFAVGAVSGTALSFELGLLWPGFMEHAGPIVGMPFSLEGFAFFLEAIFLGIYLYGWDKVSERLHLVAGVGVAICGVMSAVFVVAANAWMNTPSGIEVGPDGEMVLVSQMDAFFNPAFFTQALHMVLAAFVAVGFAVAAIHAWALLKHRRDQVPEDAPSYRLHEAAFGISMTVGAVFAILMPLSGDLSAKHLAEHQPVKLAALEGQFETETAAPLRIGGLPDEEAEETPYAIEIPYLLSILAHGDPHAEVKGLEIVPPEERPPVAVVHIAFQIMVACGMTMMLLGGVFLFLRWRTKSIPVRPWLLKAAVAAGPLGFIAVEAGWTVTEVGRQPWVVHGIMKTADAVTPMPHLQIPFIVFSCLYAFLGFMVVVLLRRFVFASLPESLEDRDDTTDPMTEQEA